MYSYAKSACAKKYMYACMQVLCVFFLQSKCPQEHFNRVSETLKAH